MEYIKDLLNKIKWSKQEQPEDFEIGYLDRIKNKIMFINFNEIIKLEDNFIEIQNNGKTSHIPIHRIKKVKKKNKIIWKR